MQTGVVREEERKCFTCQSSAGAAVSGGVDSNVEDVDRIKQFAVRYLLEVPAEIYFGDGVRNIAITRQYEMIDLCDLCCVTVRKAKELYQQLMDVVQQYRDIQRIMVEAVRRNKKKGTDTYRKVDESIAEDLVKFVSTHDYQFTGSFVIRVEDFLEHERVEEENDTVKDKDEVDRDVIAFDELEADSICSEDSLKFKADDEDDDFEDRINKLISSSSIVDGFEDEKMEDENEDWSVPGFSPKEGRDSSSNCNFEEQEYYSFDIQPADIAAPTENKYRKTPRGVTCHLCGIKNFGKVRGIQRHLREVHGIMEPPKKRIQKPKPVPPFVCCEFCGENVCTSQLLNHYRDHVGDEYLHKCSNPSCPHPLDRFPHAHAFAQHLMYLKQCQKFLPGNCDKKRMIKIRNGTQCEKCGACAPNPRVLFAHLRRRHEQEIMSSRKEFQCPISGCAEQFGLRQSVEVHILLCHDLNYQQRQLHILKSQKCSICWNAMSVEMMEIHLRGVHNATEIIKCSQCPHLFANREPLFEHLYEVHRHDEIPFVCDICQDEKPEEQLTFPDHLKLREHYFEEHQIGEKYECELCEDKKVSWTRVLFQNHMQTVHKRKTLVCGICEGISKGSSIMFKTEDTLTTHKIKVHGADPLECQQCGKTFQSLQTFKVHVRQVHIEKDQGPYKCDAPECNGMLFEFKSNLARHKKIRHPAKYHKCPHCDKEFALAPKLTVHINSVHLELRPYICDNCGESFKRDKSLRVHKRIHSGERPYLCPLCGQSFRHQSVLKTHLKSHEEKGDAFKPTGPMKHIRKRVQPKQKQKSV